MNHPLLAEINITSTFDTNKVMGCHCKALITEISLKYPLGSTVIMSKSHIFFCPHCLEGIFTFLLLFTFDLQRFQTDLKIFFIILAFLIKKWQIPIFGPLVTLKKSMVDLLHTLNEFVMTRRIFRDQIVHMKKLVFKLIRFQPGVLYGINSYTLMCHCTISPFLDHWAIAFEFVENTLKICF